MQFVRSFGFVLVACSSVSIAPLCHAERILFETCQSESLRAYRATIEEGRWTAVSGVRPENVTPYATSNCWMACAIERAPTGEKALKISFSKVLGPGGLRIGFEENRAPTTAAVGWIDVPVNGSAEVTFEYRTSGTIPMKAIVTTERALAGEWNLEAEPLAGSWLDEPFETADGDRRSRRICPLTGATAGWKQGRITVGAKQLPVRFILDLFGEPAELDCSIHIKNIRVLEWDQ